MAYIVAGVVIEKDGRYLMVQEKNPKCYGQWNWPAGYVDDGESAEQAAIREAKEEVGLDVEIGKKLGEWTFSEAGRTNVLFSAVRFYGELIIDPSEILDAKWLTSAEIANLRESMRLKEWSSDIF